MSMMVSPTTLKRKWPGSITPGVHRPDRDLVDAFAAHLGEGKRPPVVREVARAARPCAAGK